MLNNGVTKKPANEWQRSKAKEQNLMLLPLGVLT
jgi:hypothetical protein